MIMLSSMLQVFCTSFILFCTTIEEKSFYRTYIAKPDAYSLNNMRTDTHIFSWGG